MLFVFWRLLRWSFLRYMVHQTKFLPPTLQDLVEPKFFWTWVQKRQVEGNPVCFLGKDLVMQLREVSAWSTIALLSYSKSQSASVFDPLFSKAFPSLTQLPTWDRNICYVDKEKKVILWILKNPDLRRNNFALNKAIFWTLATRATAKNGLKEPCLRLLTFEGLPHLKPKIQEEDLFKARDADSHTVWRSMHTQKCYHIDEGDEVDLSAYSWIKELPSELKARDIGFDEIEMNRLYEVWQRTNQYRRD